MIIQNILALFKLIPLSCTIIGPKTKNTLLLRFFLSQKRPVDFIKHYNTVPHGLN